MCIRDRKYNVLEYKGPGDELSIDTFYKTLGDVYKRQVEDYGVSKYTPVIATLLKNPTLILPQ